MIEKMAKDEKMRRTCVLQSEDTVAIDERGASFQVLEPPRYASITTLDRTHHMFSDRGDSDECRGLFDEDQDGNAVSGSGSDVWYKVSDELVAFCTRVDKEARAIGQTIDDPSIRGLEDYLECKRTQVEQIEAERKRTLLVLDELLNARQKTEREIFQTKQELAKRKVALLEAKEKAPAAKKQRK